jgi:hypothetical protein
MQMVEALDIPQQTDDRVAAFDQIQSGLQRAAESWAAEEQKRRELFALLLRMDPSSR